MPATNFDEHITILAEESPHALVLDWYRRLELTIRDYVAAQQLSYQDGPTAEAVIKADPLLGPTVAAAIGELRRFRNQHTHEWQPIAPAESYGVRARGILVHRARQASSI